MEAKKKKSSKKSNSNDRGTGKKHTALTEATKKPAEFQSSLLKIASEVNSVGDEFSWDLKNKSSRNDTVKTAPSRELDASTRNKDDGKATGKSEKAHPVKSKAEKESTKSSAKRANSTTPIIPESKGLNDLWETAKASKAKKNLKESQVWIDNELYRKIEMLNIKNGKPVPTKHVINAILCIFLAEHKLEISKTSRAK